MQGKRIHIVHFHNGSGGGVLSVIRNLLLHSKNEIIANHVIFTINLRERPGFEPPEMAGTESVHQFDYLPEWNFYHTCRMLQKLLPNKDAVIVAHDWLELGMVSNLGLSNPVVQVLHGDYEYYYDLAVKHNGWIDGFITVAELMRHKLSRLLPERADQIYYRRFPVAENPSHCSEKASQPSILFVGRCTSAKGYPLLPEIAERLMRNGTLAKWHIVGEMDGEVMSANPWHPAVEVEFYGSLENRYVQDLMCRMHVFILPSFAEGMPVSIVEAMKAGMTPLTNDLPGGIRELIPDNTIGGRIKDNCPAAYADYLHTVFNKESTLHERSKNSRERAHMLFNPFQNTTAYENIFLAVAERAGRLIKTKKKIYGSRLDEPLIPNFVTHLFRNLNRHIK
jgi:glycosyltransferase involved in cell wall biosynthesis